MNAAIIEPSIDLNQISRDLLRVHVEYQDTERTIEAHDRKGETLREAQRRRRLEMGRLLIEAKRRTKHGGWLLFLEKLGFEPRTATNWMREAGWTDGDGKSESDSDLNPRVAAGIDRRPRKRDEQPDLPDEAEGPRPPLHRPAPAPAPEPVEEPSLFASWKRDISKALVGLDKMIMGYAKSWPKRSRSDLAKTLRSVAERIENMTGE